MTIRKTNITGALLACALTIGCASDRSAARAPMATTAAPAAVAADVTRETPPAPAPTTYSDSTRYLGTSNPPARTASGTPATAALPADAASSVRSTVTGTVLNPAGAVVAEESAIGATPATVAAGATAATAPAGSRGVSTTPAVSVDLATAASASQPTSVAGTTAPTRAERPASVAAPTAAALPVSQTTPTAGAVRATTGAASVTASTEAATAMATTEAATAVTTTAQAAAAISSTGGLNRSGGSGVVRVTESSSGRIAITNAPATNPPARRTLRQRLRDLVRRAPPK